MPPLFFPRFVPLFRLAQRTFCAAPILARAAADIRRFGFDELRFGEKLPTIDVNCFSN
jgi:hypothetical protein